jgi:hypothetical protein
MLRHTFMGVSLKEVEVILRNRIALGQQLFKSEKESGRMTNHVGLPEVKGRIKNKTEDLLWN